MWYWVDEGIETGPAVEPEVTSGDELDAARWAREKLGFEADAAQTRVLRSQTRRVLLNCTRQWGKSTVTAAKAVHQAFTSDGSLAKGSALEIPVGFRSQKPALRSC